VRGESRCGGSDVTRGEGGSAAQPIDERVRAGKEGTAARSMDERSAMRKGIRGAIDGRGVRDEKGDPRRDRWTRGPRGEGGPRRARDVSTCEKDGALL